MKACAMLASICIFFVIYWVLPNGKVPARAVLPAAMITGVLFEVLKNVYVLVLPLLDFQEVYGPFYISITLIFWAFLSGLLLLGGAYLSAAEHQQGLVDAIVSKDGGSIWQKRGTAAAVPFCCPPLLSVRTLRSARATA
jgi:uncharacterized BrkB/YihY/UPF0761 family membrane protein